MVVWHHDSPVLQQMVTTTGHARHGPRLTKGHVHQADDQFQQQAGGVEDHVAIGQLSWRVVIHGYRSWEQLESMFRQLGNWSGATVRKLHVKLPDANGCLQ